MLIDVTVKVPPRPDIVSPALDELDELDGLDSLGDEDDGDAVLDDPPEKRPITVTWCPTCCARSTPESAMSFSSRPPRPPAMLPEDDG
jgi:hypothetical protein